MTLEKNEHGVLQYPKNDARRLFVLLAAIDELDRATINTLEDFTGINKGVIATHIANLNAFYGVVITKEGPEYKIESWGEILNKKGVKKCLRG